MWSRLFKKRRTDLRNCFHPEIWPKVEKAFVGAGVHSKKTQYYRFKDNTELDMLAGRYNKATKFMIEANMRMNGEDLLFYLDKIKACYRADEVRLDEIMKWVGIVEDRTKILIEDNTAMKLASASYFDEHEMLDTYDYAYNVKKIKAWEESGDYSFFFIRPMSDLLPLPESWQENTEKMMEYINLVNLEKNLRLNSK